MVSGRVEHEDFKGHRGIIGPGDLQWMTAGRGIVHSEMPKSESRTGLQLWVNLPREHKMVAPDYQELLAKDVPRVRLGGATATVIAGTAFGVESPVRTKYTPTNYLVFTLDPGAVLTQAIPAGWNAFVYVLEGSGSFGGSLSKPAAAAAVAADGTAAAAAAGVHTGGTRSPAHHTLVLSNSGKEDGVVISAGDAGVTFALISGRPTKEPVVQHGPFVMTTHEEIAAAFEDYSRDRNGFEGASAFSADWDARHY